MIGIKRYIAGLVGREKLTLRDVRDGEKVFLVGRVSSPDVVRSPVSPVCCALLHWAVFRQTWYKPQSSTAELRSVDRAERSGILGESVIIETRYGSVVCGAHGAEFQFATPIHRNLQPLMSMPDLMRDVLAGIDRGSVVYGERYLSHGDRVVVRGSVTKLGRGAGAYRSQQPPADFAIVHDGKALIVEVSRSVDGAP